MKVLLLAGLLSIATALPIPLEQFGGSSSGQRFGFYPPQGPPFFPQILFPPPPQLPLIPIPFSFPFPYDPNQVLTLNDLITLITFILNNLGGFFGAIKGQGGEAKCFVAEKPSRGFNLSAFKV
ncbi:secretory calcium-binding phosphoprotein proline-glutamine rich 1 [Crocuta crocuta]